MKKKLISLAMAVAMIIPSVSCAKTKTPQLDGYKLLWSDDKISPEDAGEYMFRYFIRVNEADKDKAEEVFGNVKYIEADGISGEAAFITGVMTENEYNEKSGGVDIINMIRITPDTNID